ncbi:MAG: CPBP family intramembrane metalloprotease [Anaerolineaceae bacterium]|nr:MAG: CPBP family intramembrane metalloprotease [Anaerolineaceae bacterium]
MKRALIIAQGLLMAFVAFIIVSFIYTIATSIFILITGIEDVNPQIDYCLMVMAVMVAIILFYLWYRRYAVKGDIEQVEIKDIVTLKNMGIYLMMGIGCQLFVSGILSLLRPLFQTLFSYYDETISSLFVADTIIVAVYVIILAPIIEELMLRGIMFNRLRQGISFILANILQAAVFGIYHWDIVQGLYAFGLGLLLGYVYERTRTLIAPIIVHVFINGLGFLLQWLHLGQYIPIWLAIVAGGGLLFGAIYLFYKSTNFIHKI